MSKKHFKLIAEAISIVPDRNQRYQLFASIGAVLAKTNPEFSWPKWQEACGL